MDGFIVVDKPAGMTSHDVVSAVRRIAGQRKVGHTGTLDESTSFGSTFHRAFPPVCQTPYVFLSQPSIVWREQPNAIPTAKVDPAEIDALHSSDGLGVSSLSGEQNCVYVTFA
jgi:hypothetical protein